MFKQEFGPAEESTREHTVTTNQLKNNSWMGSNNSTVIASNLQPAGALYSSPFFVIFNTKQAS